MFASFAKYKASLAASLSLLGAVTLSACETTNARAPFPEVAVKTPQSEIPAPTSSSGQTRNQSEQQIPLPSSPSAPPVSSHPTPADPAPPVEQVSATPSAYDRLNFWASADTRPALRAFQKACALWGERDPEQLLNANLPDYGRYADWEAPCFLADYTADDAPASRAFFENNFQPVTISTPSSTEGLLTGYYEPEISVRRRPDTEYSEPILSLPSNEATQALPRNQISAASAPVIAFGKPIDVFFMQIQGSGRIRYDDGQIQRAAFAGHNSRPYKSIGAELIRRGVLTRETASKQSIEKWMNANSRQAVQELMNVNSRYIFFKTEEIESGQGPRGAMGVALESMGTIAVDPRYHPYGTLAWLETTLPQVPGDYIGQETGLLVSAQDTGSAIKGALRADLFFGSGERAGDLAGVMKHEVRWTVLLPTPLAYTFAAIF